VKLFPPPMVDPPEPRSGTMHIKLIESSWTTLCRQIGGAEPEAIAGLYRRILQSRNTFLASFDKKSRGWTARLPSRHPPSKFDVGRFESRSVWTVYRRSDAKMYCAAHHAENMFPARWRRQRNSESPTSCNESSMSERRQLLRDTLNALEQKQREVLVRFYLREQSAQQIMAEMDLTDTQFRSLKNSAKDRFGQLA
jgi:DNA-directed RNA polymerase specialized sigma24 family protein